MLDTRGAGSDHLPVTGTPDRLLDAAEALLAERDVNEISLRDITRLAGANVASVGYHFGSKDRLLEEVLRRALDDMATQRREALELLPDDGDLESLVRVWLAPALEMLREPSTQAARRARMLARVLAARSPLLEPIVAEASGAAEAHLLGRISALLPDLDPQELAIRHAATLGAVGTIATGGMGVLLQHVDAERAGEYLIAYALGALGAPPAR